MTHVLDLNSNANAAMRNRCRGGPPWAPQTFHIVFPRKDGHGEPPLQFSS